MNNAPLLNATIEIQEMSDKRGKFGLIKKIKGKDIESGQTNTYTVYDKKKDGSISAAWSQLQTITIGDTVQVGYAEQSGQMDDGTPFTSRIVRNFNRDIGNGVRQYQGSQQAKSPRSEALVRSQGKPETDWDQIAVGKCQTAFLAAYLQAGNTFADAKLQVVPARKLAELVVYGSQQQELPTITQDDDPAGDFNPFVNAPDPEFDKGIDGIPY